MVELKPSLQVFRAYANAGAGDAVQLCLLVSLLCAVYLQAGIAQYLFGMAPVPYQENTASRLIVEGLVVCNICWLGFTRKVRFPPGSVLLLGFVGWAVLSGLVMEPNQPWYAGLRYSRYTLYACLVYIVGWNSRFSWRQVTHFQRVVAGLLIVQLLATVYMLLVLRERTEWRVGTITTSGGNLGTIFPLLALGVCMAYYRYVRSSCWVLLLGFAFGLVGFASGKRAIYFLTPLFFGFNILLYGILRAHSNKRLACRNFAVHVLACALLVAPALLYGLRNTHLGEASRHRNSISGFLSAAVDYARKYEMGVNDRYGGVSGRTSGSLRVLNALNAAPVKVLLLGRGPSSFYGTGHSVAGGGFDDLGVTYGIVGWSHTAISIGAPGVLLFVLGYGTALVKLLRATRKRALVAGRAMVAFAGLSGGVVLLYDYCFYGASVLGVGATSFLVLLAVGLAGSSTVFSAPAALECHGAWRRRAVGDGIASAVLLRSQAAVKDEAAVAVPN